MYHGINLSWVLGFKLRPLINLVKFLGKNPNSSLKKQYFFYAYFNDSENYIPESLINKT
jgi:hypothetical protein